MFCDYISLSQVTEMHSVLYCSKSFTQSGKKSDNEENEMEVFARWH